MSLLSACRVLELVILLHEGDYIKWRAVKAQPVSLFSNSQPSISYSPSVSEVNNISPRELNLIPTPQALLFNDSSLYK